jgi:DNA-directed RNA polymerase III subunit RPC2
MAALLNHELYDDKNILEADRLAMDQDRWHLVPAFLRAQGLVKQHIDSYNHFVDTELTQILHANSQIDSDVDPNFRLWYRNIRVGQPLLREQMIDYKEITPQECRLRDLTYAAPIYVDIEFQRNRELIARKDIVIGRMPVMLRSSHCTLTYGLATTKSPGDANSSRSKSREPRSTKDEGK